MKQVAIVLVLFGVCMTGVPGAWADSGNPFGFETNAHPSEYEYCKKEPGWYREHGYSCSSAPRPHPDLRSYHLSFVEGVGLCYIAAHTNPGVKYPSFNRVGGYINIRKDYPWDGRLKLEIGNFLEEIGVERNDQNAQQLVRILEAYLSQSLIHGQRYNSGQTYDALKDAFSEMKKKWFIAGRPDVLIEWTRNLKRIIEKEIRSDSGNKFETFNRQISKKYGPSAAPDSVEDGYNFLANISIIKDTESEIRAEYNKGYEWNPEKGFDGLGDVEGIKLSMSRSKEGAKVSIYFWLATFDTCVEKIDDKGDLAF